MQRQNGLFKCFQHWCAADELNELWYVDYNIIERGYMQGLELRGIDAGHDILKVYDDPLEPKICESGEDGACPGRRTSGCPARSRSKGLEIKMENCAAGRRGKGSKHCLRCKYRKWKTIQLEVIQTRGPEGQICPRTNREGLSQFTLRPEQQICQLQE